MRLVLLLLVSPFLGIAQKIPSLSEQIGQLILMGLPDNRMDTTTLFYRDVRAGKIGGIILYERHLTPEHTAENLRLLINTYQAVASVPLLVTITQEGGLVNRLKEKYGFPPMPSAQYLGRLNNKDSTKWYSDNSAYTLSRLGINLNFAPVLDIYRANNPVLGSRERSFGTATALITAQAAQVIRSHTYFGVGTAVKHFPGHGSSTTDSHLGLTDVSETWQRTELEPFRNLIRQGLAQAVMTAHIVNRKLDPTGLPATLSRPVITGLLRGQLHFTGLVISDDMHMKAITAEYGLKEAVAKALNAGVDVLLFSGNSDTVASAGELVTLIADLVRSGAVSESRIRESYNRVMQYKKQLRLIH